LYVGGCALYTESQTHIDKNETVNHGICLGC